MCRHHRSWSTGTDRDRSPVAERARYRFGPLERRGLIAGWRGGQIASVAGGLVVAVLVLRARTSVVSVVIALVSVLGSIAFACWPISGRTGEEWFPTLLRWARTVAGGQRRRRSPVPVTGMRLERRGMAVPVPTPHWAGSGGRSGGAFASLTLRAAVGPAGTLPMGLLSDRRTRTCTAVLALRGHSFALLGEDEKERRIRSWSGVLASLAREHTAVHRLQWLATTLPDDGSAVRGYAAAHATLGPDLAARRSYEALLESSAPATSRHEVLLAVQIRLDRSTARAVRASGGGDRGAAAVLRREISALERSVAEADVVVDRVLSPRELAAVIRRSGEGRPAGDPLSGPVFTGGRPQPGGPAWPWPVATQEEWSCLRTDGTWHATYWVAEWPRVEVGPDFLAPLLLGSVRRTTAVVMEPMSPTEAVRRLNRPGRRTSPTRSCAGAGASWPRPAGPRRWNW